MITKVFTDSHETKEAYSNLFEVTSDVLTKIKNAPSGSTSITDNNQVYYEINDSLKDRINEITDSDIATEDGINIDSLGEYFSILEILQDIHPRFLRLPIDEDLFVIDANTRQIAFPQNDYVYAVLGDKNAETIYFDIDRYYDIFDLGSKDIQVLIQAEKVINGETKSFLFSATDKDVDSKPGHVIFGWVLPDDITSTSGIVRFSVRFYLMDGNNKLIFSLGTLPLSLSVENSLPDSIDASKVATIITTDTFIKNYQRSGAEPIARPTIDALTYDKNTIVLGENEFATLTCTASTPQAAKIDYAWYYQEADGGTAILAKNIPNCIERDNYKPIKGLSKDGFNDSINNSLDTNNNIKYYILRSGGYWEVEETDKITVNEGEESDPAGITLYEKVEGKTLETTQGGIYFCRIKVTASRYSDTIDSDSITVAYACPVNFNKNLSPAYFTTGTVNNGVVTYSLTSDDFAINSANVKWTGIEGKALGDDTTTTMLFTNANDSSIINLTDIKFNEAQVLSVNASLTNTVNNTSKTTTDTAQKSTKFYKPLCSFTIGLDETAKNITINYDETESEKGYIKYNDDLVRDNDSNRSRVIKLIYLTNFDGSTKTMTASSLDDLNTQITNLPYRDVNLSQYVKSVQVTDTIFGETITETLNVTGS